MSEKTHGDSRVSEEAAPMTDSELAQSISEMSKGYGVIHGVPKSYSVNTDSDNAWMTDMARANRITHTIPLEDTEVIFNKGALVSILIGAAVGIIGLIALLAIAVADILELFS